MIDFAVRLGSVIGIFFYGVSQFSFEIELWTKPLIIPGASIEVVEPIEEQRLIYPIVQYNDGSLMSEGENMPSNRLERLRLLRNRLNEEPRIIALLIIEKDTPMKFVYSLTEELRIAGLYRIHFATGSGDERNIR
ncbi:MAG: hypothetical protein JJ971_10165 [Balneolaceae bacterium]|nr:hypothetical protein [Balneolaceae bacterium]MBO6546392.1 hypothetical protein [Balneolaceae bacterium]MBO6648751.1 hypothetical protein [Balneolaceae bacterium]